MASSKNINDAILDLKFTGECPLDLDLALKYFDDNTSISYIVTRHNDRSETTEYRIYLVTPKTQRTISKFTISESDAFALIEKLKLMHFPGMTTYSGNYYPLYSKIVLREDFCRIPSEERTCTLDEYIVQRRIARKEEIKASKKK